MNNLNDAQDDYSDIQASHFNNEREFNKELEEIMALTKDISADWKKREAAIKRIGGIILSNWGNSSTFIKIFNQKLYLNLSIQLVDLRSSLMKEACRIVILASRTYNEAIESAVEKLLSPLILFKLVGTANRLISDSGSHCIAEMIKNIESVKIVSRIHEQMKNKCNTVRLRASEQFLYIISKYSKITINKCISLIEEFIHGMVHDANMEVRACGRKIYIKYQEINHNPATKLFNSFDNNIQKSINEDLNKEDADEGMVMQINVTKSKIVPLSNTISVSQSFSKTLNSKTNTNKKNIGNSETNIIGNKSKIFDSPENSPERKKIMSRTIADQVQENNNNKFISSLSTGTYQQNQISKIETKAKNLTTKFNKINLDYKSNNPEINNFTENTNISLSHTADKNIKNNESREIYQEDVPYYNTNYNYMTKYEENSRKVFETQKSKKIEEIIKDRINSILYDNDEASKLISFEQISSLFNEIYSNIDNISKATLKNLVTVHISNLSESFYKLTIGVMKNLIKFIFYLDDIFTEDHINKITKFVIINISSDKNEVSENAQSLYEIMRKKIDSNLLIKSIIQIIEINVEDELLRVCFEVIIPLIDTAVLTLSVQNYLNGFVLRIIQILDKLQNYYNKDKNNTNRIFKKILDVVESIYKKYPKQFLYSILILLSDGNDNTYYNFIMNIFENDKSHIYEYIINSQNNNSSLKKINSISNLNKNLKTSHKEISSQIPTLNNLNTCKKINNASVSVHNNINENRLIKVFDENRYTNFNSSNVNYEILSIAAGHDFNSFLSYLKSDPFSNVENFLLALDKIKYESVLPILNHIHNILINKDKDILFDFIPLLINRIVLLFQKFSSEFSDQLRKILNLVPVRLDKELHLQIIPKYITARQSPLIVQTLLNSMRNVVTTIEHENLLMLLPSFIETIFNTLNHHISDVRKIAVYCIVDLYFYLGKDFDAYMNELNHSQRNLINIYIKKKGENK